MATATEPRARHTESGLDDEQSPLAHLSDEQIEELGRHFDAIHDEIYSELGDRDRKYIVSMIEMHRRLAVMGRVWLLGARFWPAWVMGTATTSLAKILENMEIGHNVMHGQWDWMNDPQIHSSTWDWDTASTKEAWKHSHNFIHHTYTNIRGKDKDLGYEIMRIDPHQKWHPVYLLQPFYNALLMAFFEWGVAFHDLDLEAIRAGEKSQKEVFKDLKGIAGKARNQVIKDYVAWPLISGLAMAAATFVASPELRAAPKAKKRKRKGMLREAAMRALQRGRENYFAAVKANATANIVRNLWAHAIIFCGHFPDQTYTFSQEETENETRGQWYGRQLVGAANIEGSPLFHVISGNLGYQVEHHLFPDMPSTRYAEIAPRVKAICEHYGLPYNTGPFFQQWGMVNRTILRLAFPGGKARPKPGPFKGGDGETATFSAAAGSTNGSSTNGKATPDPQRGGSGKSGPEQRQSGVRVQVPDRE